MQRTVAPSPSPTLPGSCALPGYSRLRLGRVTASLALPFTLHSRSFRDRSRRARVVVVSRQRGFAELLATVPHGGRPLHRASRRLPVPAPSATGCPADPPSGRDSFVNRASEASGTSFRASAEKRRSSTGQPPGLAPARLTKESIPARTRHATTALEWEVSKLTPPRTTPPRGPANRAPSERALSWRREELPPGTRVSDAWRWQGREGGERPDNPFHS
jgi:hypothetical protein